MINFVEYAAMSIRKLAVVIPFLRLQHLSGTENRNPAAIKLLISFSIDNYIANTSLYALNRYKLNFGCYLTFEFAV